MEYQPFLQVRQHFPSHKLQDIPGEVRRQLNESGFASRLRPGSRVAIGCGSRGIANIDVIVREIVAWWKEQGMQPFIFPAMGTTAQRARRDRLRSSPSTRSPKPTWDAP